MSDLIFQCCTTAFNKALLGGIHDFSLTSSQTFKIALYDATASLGTTTTAYTTTGEISATGYTAGGASLTLAGTASAGTVGYTSFSDVTWTGSGISAAGALIYNSTASGNPSVAVLSFGLTRYAVGTSFAITFPTNDSTSAIIRINAPAA